MAKEKKEKTIRVSDAPDVCPDCGYKQRSAGHSPSICSAQKWAAENSELVLAAKYRQQEAQSERAESQAVRDAVSEMREKSEECEESRLIPLGEVAHAFHVATCLIDSCDDVRGIAVSDFACLIDNSGNECERAEAILALAPIAERVNDRIESAKEAVRKPIRERISKVLKS